MCKLRNSLLVGLALVLLLGAGASDGEDSTPRVERLSVRYTDAVRQALQSVPTTGFGSGLAFRKMGRGGKREFYLLSDAPSSTEPVETFTPFIGVVTVKDGSAQLSKLIRLKGSPAVFPEWTEDQPGFFDAEGIAPYRGESLWIADEKIPALVEIESESGKLRRVLQPGTGLPEIVSNIQPNRGFEGIAVTPRGTVYAALQSTLDIRGETKDTATFIRIIEFDPARGASRTFAYPHEIDSYARRSDGKLGGLQALDDNRFLLIERGVGPETRIAKIFLITIDDETTDISGLEVNGQAPEYVESSEELFGVGMPIELPVQKELLVDLVALGWPHGKAEGVTILDDGQTLVVSNDSDLAPASLSGDATDSGTELWFITLAEPLIRWGWKEYALLAVLALICAIFMLFLGALFWPKKAAV